MQQVFKNAFYFKEPTVLKRRLVPLCCGHVMILIAAESPYCEGNSNKPTMSDLVLAVGICSRTTEDAEAWLKSPTLADDLKAWGKSCSKLQYEPESALFEKYLTEFSAFPERWPKEKKSTPCLHPWPLMIAAMLMPIVGESRAWNMPLPKAISLWSVMKELQGDASLKSDVDIKNMAILKKLKAENERKEIENEK